MLGKLLSKEDALGQSPPDPSAAKLHSSQNLWNDYKNLRPGRKSYIF